MLWAKKNIFDPSLKTLDINLLTILGSAIRTGLASILCFLLIGSSTRAFGQITFDSKEELIEAANSFFESGEYSKAKPLFSQLLSQDALNPNYNYRFGVCILFTEDDPVKPMPYIEGGTGSPGVNDEAFYFLGKLYQFNYRFDDAIEAFNKAKAKQVQLSGVSIDGELQACRNGKLLYNPEYDFQPASSKGAIEKEFFRPYDFRKLKGKVIPMPPQFKTKYDQKNLVGSFIFTPLVGQVLFYASYGEDGATGKDIYRVRKLPNGEWALPVRLPNVINSDLDEDHAFYDAQNDVLYFSSQGHNSMGGLDIFQSAYDAANDSWSEPINLQYPYSSPFDDYLYVTDPNLSVAYFTSTRASEEGRVQVYRMNLPDKEGDPVSIITGQYLESEDSTQTKMKAQLRANNELIGEYRSNPTTGKYVIVAEPGQGYQLSIAPRDQEAFTFDVDLPKHFKFKPLEQQSLLNTTNDQYSLELTNYFNNRGKEDTIVKVQSKTTGELPGLVASVGASTDENAEDELAALEEKARDEARREIAEIEQQVKEKARQDSIAQAEALAAEEVRKADEAAELAKRQEQARSDSIAEVERLAAEAEAKRKQEEAEQLAKAELEKDRQDSIARAEALAAEEARKASEAAELAKRQEQARSDSIAEVERLAAEAEAKRKQEEAEQLAKAEAEKAHQDSIAQVEALAAEEVRKAAEAAELAKRQEQARSDSIAEVERLAAEAEAKRKQEEAEQLAKAKAEKARQDSIARAEALAAEEVRKAAEAAELAKQQEQARIDSVVEVERLAAEAELKRQQDEVEQLAKAQELARKDSIARVELIALEQSRLDSINREVEAVKAAAIREAELADQGEESQELLEQLAQEQANQERATSQEDVEEAKNQLSKESEATSTDELEMAKGQTEAENLTVQSSEVAEAEAMAEEIEGNSELDSLNAELANLMIRLSDEGVERPELAEEAIALSDQIAELEQIEADKKAERVLAALDDRMAATKELEQAKQKEEEQISKAVEQKGEGVLSLEAAIADAEQTQEVKQLAEEARQDSAAQAEALAAEEARKAAEAADLAKQQEQARLDSIAEVERLAAETELKRQQEEAEQLAKEQAEKARQDSIAQAEALAAEEARKAAEVAELLAKEKEQARLDSIADVERIAAEAVLRAKTNAEKAKQDSIEQAKSVATAVSHTDSEEVLSEADAFMKAIEEAEQQREEQAQESDSKTVEISEAAAEGEPLETELVPSGDPFIQEVMGAGLEVAEKDENREKVETSADAKQTKADSLARELEMEMARAESEAMEQAMKDSEEVTSHTDTSKKETQEVALLEEDVNDAEVLESVKSELESQLKEVVPEHTQAVDENIKEVAEEVEMQGSVDVTGPIDGEAETVEVEPETDKLEAQELAKMEQARLDSIAEVERLAEEAEAKLKQEEAERLALAEAEKVRQDSIDRVEAEVAAAEELLRQQAAEKAEAEEEARKAAEAAELAIKEAEQSRLDSITKAEELTSMEAEKVDELAKDDITEVEEVKPEEVLSREVVEEKIASREKVESVAEEPLSEADAFMKAIEDAEKAKAEKERDDNSDDGTSEEIATATETVEESTQGADPKLELTRDQLLMQRHRELAAQKERELREKMNADRAALGLAIEEEPTEDKTEEIEPEESAVVKEVATTENELINAEETESMTQEINDREDEEVAVVKEPEVAVTEEIVEEPVVEPKAEETPVEETEQTEVAQGITTEDKAEPNIKVIQIPSTEEAMNVEAAIAEGSSRIFFITPALRDYSKRKVDFSTIENKAKRRLIRRMLAEDRGRLGVLKNIHNSRIEYAGDSISLAQTESNERNKEVLSGLALANALVKAESSKSDVINWLDRKERQGITYRLMFQLRPGQVSEWILDAVAASGQPDVEVDGSELHSSFHTKLAEARAEFLEYRSRGYSNLEIQAYDNGSPIRLMEAMNRAVIEK